MWGLRVMNFEVDQGEVVGIIGSNGAGKSTLLKILSRITEPTTGRIELRGKVGSLLEVGTGFHPELTGRENVFLNGAILGMKREEIARKFDEIVDFSGIERFIDTPVKHYSSGMYVRLAFAVAAHLDPEILIIDEVLAVGDAKFQKKCLSKMHNISSTGRTVLFVSHSMTAITRLCPRVLLLSDGRIVADGSAESVKGVYLGADTVSSSEVHWPLDEAPGSEQVKLLSIRILNEASEPADMFTRSDEIVGELQFVVLAEGLRLNPHVHVFNISDELLFISTNLNDPEQGRRRYAPGQYVATFKIPRKLLNTGKHFVSVYLISDLSNWDVHIDRMITFEVVEDGTDRGDYSGGWAGLLRPLLEWSIHPQIV
jgi:lipopolysaccharide transport system ATP-binding protein